jgi:hypothetical protein
VPTTSSASIDRGFTALELPETRHEKSSSEQTVDGRVGVHTNLLGLQFRR